MKHILMALVLFHGLASAVSAQDDIPKDAPSLIPSERPRLEAEGVRPEAETAPDKKEECVPQSSDSEWKPKLMVSLSITDDGRPKMAEREVMVFTLQGAGGAASTSDFESRLFQVRTEENSDRHFVPNSARKMIVEPGVILLWCDNVSVNVTTSDNGESTYGVKCDGKVSIGLGSIITGESFELKSGSINMTNVSFKLPGPFEVATPEVTIPLSVFGVSTQKFDKPLTTLEIAVQTSLLIPPANAQKFNAPLQPQPDPISSPGKVFDREARAQQPFFPDPDGDFRERETN